jgi:site-specific DNA-methyltransferase (adenine-specific)
MRRYPDKHFDLAIVDPPYGDCGGAHDHHSYANNVGSLTNGKHKSYARLEHIPHRRTEKSTAYSWAKKYSMGIEHTWDVAPEADYFKELFRLAPKVIVWGGNYFSDKLPPSRNFVIWKKLTISENFTMAMAEYAWTNIPGNAKIIEAAPQNRERFHPTQKPVEVYKKLLQWYSKPGDTILDTHLGSGSIAIACIDMGCDLTACEIDTFYYDSAMRRITKYQTQKELFDAAELRLRQSEMALFSAPETEAV